MPHAPDRSKPSGRETRRRLALGAGFGLVSGLAAVVFSGSVAFGALFGFLMALPALISSRRPAPQPPSGATSPASGTERQPRRRLSNTAKAVLGALVFAALRLIGELNQAVEPVFAVGRALIIGALFGVILWIALYANDRRKEERETPPPT